MVERNGEHKVTVMENVQGGPGSAEMTRLANKYQLFEHGRLYNVIRLVPGSGIGEHTHVGECEVIYVMSGTADYFDNGEMTTLSAGDVTYCGDGETHWIRNNSADTDLQIVALIVVK